MRSHSELRGDACSPELGKMSTPVRPYVRLLNIDARPRISEYGNRHQWTRGNWGAVSHNLVDRGSGYRTREGRVEVLIALAAWQTPMVTLAASMGPCPDAEVNWIYWFSSFSHYPLKRNKYFCQYSGIQPQIKVGTPRSFVHADIDHPV